MNNNETIFRPSVIAIIFALFCPLLLGIFFLLGYFEIISSGLNGLGKILMLFLGFLLLFRQFVPTLLFMPIFVQIENSTICFKKLIPPFFHEIPYSSITKIHIRYERQPFRFKRWSRSYPRFLESITIHTAEKGILKTNRLFVMPWNYPNGGKLVKKIKQDPFLSSKIKEITGIYLLR